MINKIKLIFLAPQTLVFIWLGFLLSPLLNLFRLHFIVKRDLLPIDIRGLSSLLLYFPILCSILATVVLSIWFKEYIHKKLTYKHIWNLKILTVFSLFFLIINRYLQILEIKNYPNFVYEHFGIIISQLELMFFIAGLQVVFFIFVYVFNLKLSDSRSLRVKVKTYKKRFINSTGEVALLATFLGLSSLIVNTFNSFLNLSILSRQEKGGYESRVGTHYKYIEKLMQKTPSGSNIIHPPQGEKWPAIGNQPILRYFLYPRTLISGALLNDQKFTRTIDDAYFIEIDSKEEMTHWPIINSKVKTIMFDEKNPISYELLTTYYSDTDAIIFKVKF